MNAIISAETGENYSIFNLETIRIGYHAVFGGPSSVSPTAAFDQKVTILALPEAVDVLTRYEVHVSVAGPIKALEKDVREPIHFVPYISFHTLPCRKRFSS